MTRTEIFETSIKVSETLHLLCFHDSSRSTRNQCSSKSGGGSVVDDGNGPGEVLYDGEIRANLKSHQLVQPEYVNPDHFQPLEE